MTDLPTLRLVPKGDRRLSSGFPWIFSNEIVKESVPTDLPAGALVRLQNAAGELVGQAFHNRHTLIAARLLHRSPKVAINQAFFAERLRRALALRDSLIGRPFYRLIHAEADGLPGTIIDRFGDCLVVQLNCAGMERHQALLLAALEEVLAPHVILLKDEAAARTLEGLPGGQRLYKGQLGDRLEIEENGARFFTDLSAGQKTGWFFDQRDNRAWAARFAKGARVLDAYCYAGGFGVLAALSGASDVLALDSSEKALSLARAAAEANGVAARMAFEKTDVFQRLPRLADEKRLFDLTICDPPAFIKTRKESVQGLKGYRKLARLAAQVTAPQGTLVIASCSHHADAASFTQAVAEGIADIGRSARILQLAGAAPDHPVHPLLPETSYLKCLTLALD